MQFYRADTVTDLNNEGIGGVPALFKSFTTQAGLDYDVSLETRGGSGLDFHLENKLAAIGSKPWDKVVMHGQSTLDFDKPGDPAKLVATTRKMADFLRERNPKVEIFLTATWSRADQHTKARARGWGSRSTRWRGMCGPRTTRGGRRRAECEGVIPVGEAWNRAIQTGIADPNPYDGIEANKNRPVGVHDHCPPARTGITSRRCWCSVRLPGAIRARSAKRSAPGMSWACRVAT